MTNPYVSWMCKQWRNVWNYVVDKEGKKVCKEISNMIKEVKIRPICYKYSTKMPKFEENMIDLNTLDISNIMIAEYRILNDRKIYCMNRKGDLLDVYRFDLDQINKFGESNYDYNQFIDSNCINTSIMDDYVKLQKDPFYYPKKYKFSKMDFGFECYNILDLNLEIDQCRYYDGDREKLLIEEFNDKCFHKLIVYPYDMIFKELYDFEREYGEKRDFMYECLLDDMIEDICYRCKRGTPTARLIRDLEHRELVTKYNEMLYERYKNEDVTIDKLTTIEYINNTMRNKLWITPRGDIIKSDRVNFIFDSHYHDYYGIMLLPNFINHLSLDTYYSPTTINEQLIMFDIMQDLCICNSHGFHITNNYDICRANGDTKKILFNLEFDEKYGNIVNQIMEHRHH